MGDVRERSERSEPIKGRSPAPDEREVLGASEASEFPAHRESAPEPRRGLAKAIAEARGAMLGKGAYLFKICSSDSMLRETPLQTHWLASESPIRFLPVNPLDDWG